MSGEQYIWLMDSEFCCKCGAVLDYFESTLCTFCYEEQGRDEERAYLMGEYDDMNEEIPKPKDHITIRLEWKPQDCWIGVYTRKIDLFPWNYRRRWQRDIWICILPMLPIHLWWTRTEKP